MNFIQISLQANVLLLVELLLTFLGGEGSTYSKEERGIYEQLQPYPLIVYVAMFITSNMV